MLIHNRSLTHWQCCQSRTAQIILLNMPYPFLLSAESNQCPVLDLHIHGSEDNTTGCISGAHALACLAHSVTANDLPWNEILQSKLAR